MREITMGNFFSGSGTWELAAQLFGIKCLWESEIEPFPVALEAKRFPDAVQLGDVSKVNGAEIEPVDIMTNSSPCFAGGSFVRTINGIKEIADVVIGDFVLTHGKRFCQVTDKALTGRKKVVRLKAMGVDEIIATPNHPFYVRHMKRYYPSFVVDGKVKRGNTRILQEPEWKQLKDLTRMDYIGMPVCDDGQELELSDEALWLVGRYIADGYRRKGQRTVSLCIGKKKFDAFMEHINEYTGYIDRGRTAYKYCISGKEFYELCAGCGDGAANKHFPSWAFTCSNRQLGIILDGYMSGDGCIKMSGHHTASTVSRTLAYDLQYAVMKLYKCPCRLYFTKRKPTCVIEGRTVNQRDTYSIVFVPQKHKQDKAFYEDGYVWLPVKSIEECGEEDVYNLTVAKDNSYTVQNVAVHNCQDLSVAGKRDGLTGDRSSLFHEVIRITKEMRDRERVSGRTDEHIRPRFWCWENVPGAFSSNRGEDFRTVIEEVARIIDPTTVIPLPDKGKWGYAGVVDGDGWQIAWRTMDAQFFGVPQRRRRVFLVGDFAGHCAGEVLFERESVSWDFAEIAETWKDTSRSLGDRINDAGGIVSDGVRKIKEGMDNSVNRE